MTEVRLIRDPVVAAAASICWLSRWSRAKVTGIRTDVFHPGTCRYCQIDDQTLIHALNDFLDWAGMRPSDVHDPFNPEVVPWRWEVEEFARLPAEEQRHIVLKEQGFDG